MAQTLAFFVEEGYNVSSNSKSSLLRVKCRWTGRCQRTKENEFFLRRRFLRCKGASATNRAGYVRVERIFPRRRTFFFGEVFYFMAEETVCLTKKGNYWKRLCFGSIWKKRGTQRLAYIAIFAALNIVINRLSLPLGSVQFSFSTFFAALTGVIIGPLFGFFSAFMGDLVGFFIGASSYAYSPWIGISTSLFAFLIGGMVYLLPARTKPWLYVKLVWGCIISFFVCSVAINSTYLYLLLYSSMDFWEFLIIRFFVQGQIWNSLVNYALLFVCIPALNGIKPLKLHLY